MSVNCATNEMQRVLTFDSAPPKLPKLRLGLLACRLDGGRPPPLAGGCGIGDGDVWGDVTRGFDGVLTAKEFVDWLTCCAAFCAAVEASAGRDPNCMLLPPIGFPATGPPFGMYPDAPAALIVTEGLRL